MPKDTNSSFFLSISALSQPSKELKAGFAPTLGDGTAFDVAVRMERSNWMRLATCELLVISYYGLVKVNIL